ncbi:MAG: TadE family protein, partial [Chloroflexota bacterium]
LVPLLLLLIFGSLDFGRAYFSWIILTNGAREGARTAAVGANAAAVSGRVQSAVSGLPVASAVPDDCPAGAGASEWCIEIDNVAGQRGQPVTVRLEYNFRFMVAGLWGGDTAVFPIVAESTMRLE